MFNSLVSIPAATTTKDFMIPVLANESSDLAEKYDTRLLGLVKNTENQEETDEVVREAFQRAYEQLEKFRKQSRFLTDIIQSVLNQSLRKSRR